MLATRTEARCDSPGCREALLFEYRWLTDYQVEVRVRCRRCKQVHTWILKRDE